jgi:polyisoprenoid-binding protein YceI
MKTIIKSTIFTIAFFASFNIGFAQNKWNIDKSHSSVKFSVAHMTISEVEGNFKNFDGTIEATKEDFTDAKIAFTVEVGSINTDNEGRDKHLKSDDFFAADKFPKMSFKSTSFNKLSTNNYVLTGELTIRSTTKTVKFAVVYGGTVKDGYGNTRAGFKAQSSIDRFDYGLNWNQLVETGGLVVGKEVSIILNLEFVKQK